MTVNGDKTFRIKNFYTRHIPIDDGFEGGEIRMLPVCIRRFTVKELQEFHNGFVRLMNPESARLLARKPDGDEQELDDKKKFIVNDAIVRERRLAEMTPEARAKFDALERAEEDYVLTFCTKAISDHVWLPPGVNVVLEDDDANAGEPVKRGEKLAAVFAGNLSMLLRITKAVHEENTLSTETKKILRSLSGSTASLPMPGDVVADGGEKQAATVSNAGTAASAPSDGASEDQAQTPSGLTPVGAT